MTRAPSQPPASAGAVLLLVVAGLLAAADPIPGQSSRRLAAPRPTGEPGWLSAWSPLRPIGSLLVERPGADPLLTGLLVEPAPRMGGFWTAGNPGALAGQVEGSRTTFRSGVGEYSGGYRRPLDPGVQTHRRLQGRSWGQLGEDGAGIGHVAVLRNRFSDAHASVPVPYRTSPLAVGDSLGHAMNRTVARVEGAGGWRIGEEFGVGVALGFVGQEARTVASPVPRSVRVAAPGLSAGVTWRPAAAAPRLGAFGRWRRTVRDVQAFAQTASNKVLEFVGYDEPPTVGLTPAGGGAYSRRLVRHGRSAGVSLSGRDLDLRWVAFGEREAVRDERFQDLTGESVREVWEADGWSGGVGLGASLGPEVRAHLVGRYRTVSGDLDRPQFEEATYRADVRRWEWTGDLRLDRPPWRASLRLLIQRDARTRRDEVVGVESRIVGWETGVGLEISRRVVGALRAALGGGLTSYVPTEARIPAPSRMGELYREWIAPEMALYATPATVRSASLTVSLDIDPASRVWLAAGYGTVSVDDPAVRLGDAPTEARHGGKLELGVRLGGG